MAGLFLWAAPGTQVFTMKGGPLKQIERFTQWSVSPGAEGSSLSQVIQLRDGSYAAVGSLFLEFKRR